MIKLYDNLFVVWVLFRFLFVFRIVAIA